MKNFENLKDEDLLSHVREGNHIAEETLFLRYVPRVRSIARPYFLAGGDFEDLIQEGMIGLMSAVSGFTSGKDASFATYAVSCIRNRIISALRSAASEKNGPLNFFVSLDSGISGHEPFSDPEAFVISNEACAEISRLAENVLSGFEKKVLAFYLEGLSYAEISAKTSKPAKSVDNAVQRIRRKLSACLKNGNIG